MEGYRLYHRIIKVFKGVFMLTKKEVLDIALSQLAIEYHVDKNIFYEQKNVLSKRVCSKRERIDLHDSKMFNMLSIFGISVTSCEPNLFDWVQDEIMKKQANWIFDFYMLRKIDQKLYTFGHEIDQVLLHYLPNPEKIKTYDSESIKWFDENEIMQFKGDIRFDEAFCFNPEAPDFLGVALYENDQIIGMAGVSKDSENLYQIGINVDPSYRHQGIGTKLVSLLTKRLLDKGIVCFYKTSISHTNSSRVAINSGYFLAWVELTTKKQT
jgi:RimJ/RimL family protein N-acetyltransferase